jgi:hypothetical protein
LHFCDKLELLAQVGVTIMSILEKSIKIIKKGIVASGAAVRLLIGAGAAAVLFTGLIKKRKK